MFTQSRQTLSGCGLDSAAIDFLLNPDWSLIEPEIEWLKHPDRFAFSTDDSAYPPLLQQISSPPPILFATGQADALSRPQIAIVGSRSPSPSGQKTARQFASALAANGFCITSGLALGIDAAAHQGALDAAGTTIAVTGTGLDRVYPARHKQLSMEIARNGALVSEFMLGTGPQPGHFPRRNRIISGMSLGVLVVEAAIRSGSLITARLALEQGRDVFAIPGSIHNPLAKGCNWLIREGARLVETEYDILEEITGIQTASSTSPVTQPGDTELDNRQKKILNFVAYDPTSIDTLVRETGESAETIASTLLVLELQGHVELVAGGLYTRLQ